MSSNSYERYLGALDSHTMDLEEVLEHYEEKDGTAFFKNAYGEFCCKRTVREDLISGCITLEDLENVIESACFDGYEDQYEMVMEDLKDNESVSEAIKHLNKVISDACGDTKYVYKTIGELVRVKDLLREKGVVHDDNSN